MEKKKNLTEHLKDVNVSFAGKSKRWGGGGCLLGGKLLACVQILLTGVVFIGGKMEIT